MRLRGRAAGRWAAAGLLGLAASLGAAPLASAQQTLDLEQAIQTALVRNPSIASAEASAATADAQRWADWGAFLPSASLSAGVSRTDFRTITFLNPDGTTTILDNPVDDLSRGNSAGLNLNLQLSAETFTGVKAGGARSEAADLRLSAARAAVVRGVKVAYFEALKRQRLVQVAERQADARRRDFELTQERYRIAAASRSDLLGFEIELRNAELQVLAAEDAFRAAVRSLRVAQGVDEMVVDSLRLAEPPPPPDPSVLDINALLAAARSANPDLRALAAEERAASAAVWSARASYFPTLNANLRFGRGRQVADGESWFTFSPANTNRGLSLSLSLPLFNGFQRKTRNAQASNQLAAARADLRARELAVEQEVRGLVDDIQRGARRLEVLDRNAELAAERLDLTREEYRIGSADYSNLQQAVANLDDAEGAVFEQRYELLKRWAELEELVGDALR